MTSLQQTLESFAPFFSSKNAQIFLYNSYSKLQIPEAKKKSYENCYSFLYYLEHGKNYYSMAEQAPISIQPTLLFYGMIQFIKACLLIEDPFYPDTTAVLAHGATTRKRKKKYYEFLQDEIKIQKNGLFTHTAEKLFKISHSEGEKYTMKQLLTVIPEIGELLEEKLPMHRTILKNNELSISCGVLDSYHMTAGRFSRYLPTVADYLVAQSITEEHIVFQCTRKIPIFSCLPFSFHNGINTFYLPATKGDILPFPELLVHYLLLYNLSSISRYETEWWYHMLHHYEGNDFPFIQVFLSVTKTKVPFILSTFLEEKRRDFTHNEKKN